MEKYSCLEQFELDMDNWDLYLERLELVLTLNKVEENDEEGRKAALLTVDNKKTYALLRKLCAPHKPAEKAFKELCELIQQHCKPAPSEIVQQFKFRKRVRQQGETIADYLAALRELAADCNFGAELDSNLRDQLVCVVNNAKIRARCCVAAG